MAGEGGEATAPCGRRVMGVTWLRTLQNTITQSWWMAILREHDTEPTEMSGGLLKVTIALWLLMPFQALSSAFGAVNLIPEVWWAIFLLVVGMGHLAALRNGHPAWRQWGCLIGVFVWGALAISLWANGIVGLAPVMFAGACLSQGWCYIRLGRIT